MGFNTTLFIMNDCMDAIDKDPAGWWAATKEAMYKRSTIGEPVVCKMIERKDQWVVDTKHRRLQYGSQEIPSGSPQHRAVP